ncbi:MAG: STAS domain-containing protein [Terracidiphilus sp.]
MAINVEDKNGRRCIRLDDVVDIAQAADLKEILIDAIGSFASVRVEVSGASAIDVTTVQLLWTALSHASSAGKDFAIEGRWNKEIERSLSGTGISPILHSMLAKSAEEESNVLAARN